MNVETIDALEEVNQFTKVDYSEKLEEHIIAAQEHKMISGQINDKLKDMVEDDEDLEATDVNMITLRT